MGCSSAVSGDGGGSGGGTTDGATSGGAPSSGGVGGPGSGGLPTGSGGVPGGSGGVPGGSGGVPGGAGGAPTGSGGGTGAACEATATNNGYMDNGTLCGYAWTAVNGEGEPIDPPCTTSDGSDCFMGATICASAEIPANDPENSVYTGAMVGWNVGQPSGTSTAGTWVATGTGITVNYTATGATGEVRVMVQSGSTDYCAVATSGQAIPWASFTKECWTGGAMSPAFSAGSPIKAIVVQVNGSDTAAQSVSALCLESVTVN